MGQRTAILLKKNYADRSTITLIHHQWGYGKTMPMLFLQELLRCCYPLDTRAYQIVRDSHIKGYEGKKVEPIDIEFTFEPLNSEYNNYITDQTVPRDLDVFSVPVMQEFFNQTDNNNGGMIVEVTQKYDSNGRPLVYGDDFMDVVIGFVLGSEECDYYHSNLKDRIEIEQPFSRVLSATEYMTRTLTSLEGDRPLREYDKKLIKYMLGMFDVLGVEYYEDKDKARKIKKRIKLIKDTVQALTKDLQRNELIEVPRELIEKEPVFI